MRLRPGRLPGISIDTSLSHGCTVNLTCIGKHDHFPRPGLESVVVFKVHRVGNEGDSRGVRALEDLPGHRKLSPEQIPAIDFPVKIAAVKARERGALRHAHLAPSCDARGAVNRISSVVF